jgi:hypothetical protein
MKERYKAKELKDLRATVKRLLIAMAEAEEMLRHPTDPFVMVNTANYLNQERTQKVG